MIYQFMRYIRYTRNNFVDFFINILMLLLAWYMFVQTMDGILSYAKSHNGRLPGMPTMTPTNDQIQIQEGGVKNGSK